MQLREAGSVLRSAVPTQQRSQINMCRDVVPWLPTPTFALRAMLAALAAAVLLSIGNVVLAKQEPAPPVAEDQRMLPYAQPGQRIDIGGRPSQRPLLGKPR